MRRARRAAAAGNVRISRAVVGLYEVFGKIRVWIMRWSVFNKDMDSARVNSEGLGIFCQ